MTRAFWASLGAGTTIVFMGVVVLAAVSTVVAFKGWPGAPARGAATPPAMQVPGDGFQMASAEVAVERVVVPEAVAVAAPVRGVAAAPTTDSGAPLPNVGVSAPTGEPGGSASVKPTGDGGGTKPTPDPEPPKPGDPVRETGTTLSAATQDGVNSVGESLAPVSPTLGKTVGDVGRVVGDTLTGVTETVADLIDGGGAKVPQP